MADTNSKSKNYKKKRFLSSYGDALSGVKYLWGERNFKFHVISTVVAFIVAFYLDFSKGEYAILALTCGLVLISEGFNTTVEWICDRITTEHDPVIGKIKDTSAGVVLISSWVSIIVGILLYLDKIIELWTSS